MDETEPALQLISRRMFLKGLGVATTAVLAPELLSACSAGDDPTPITLYAENYMLPLARAKAAEAVTEGGLDVNAAFAIPLSATKNLLPFKTNTDYINLLRTASANGGSLGIAIGGYGNPSKDKRQTHLGILDAFHVTMDDPRTFAANAVAQVLQLQTVTGLKFERFDLDMEYPLAEDAEPFLQLVTATADMVHEKMGADAEVTLAVAAHGLPFDMKSLIGHINAINGMFYDYKTPLNNPAALSGDIAPADRVVTDALAMIAMLGGDASLLRVGFPAYGYFYGGVDALGTTYDNSRAQPVAFRDIPPDAVRDTGEFAGHNQAAYDGGVATFVSPRQAGATLGDIRKQAKKAGYGKLGGAMIFSANYLSKDYLAALRAA